MLFETTARLATAIANCRPHERAALTECESAFKEKGELSTEQTSFVNAVYFRVYRELVKAGVAKKRRWWG